MKHFKYSVLHINILWMIKTYLVFISLMFVTYLLVYNLVETSLENDIRSAWPIHQTRDARKFIIPNKRTTRLVPKNKCNNEHKKLIIF